MSIIFDKFKLKYEELENRIYSHQAKAFYKIRKRKHYQTIPPEILTHIQIDKDIARLYLKYFGDEDE